MALRAVTDHPKFSRLKMLLGQPKGAALGWLESIWHFTGRFTPHGNIGKYSDLEIEAWVEWNGTPGTLIAGLVKAGWLDDSPAHRLLVHDWQLHADNATKLSVKRSGKAFCVDSVCTVSTHCGDTVVESSTVCGLPGPGPGPGPVPEPGPETSSAKAEPKQSPSPRDPIEEIYKAFPRKIGKDNALKAIGKAVDRLKVRGHTTRQAQEFLYKVTVAFAKSPAGNDGNFTPHPATWFNQGRYDDDQAEWLKQGGKLDRPTFETSSKVQYTDPENVYNGPAYQDGRNARGAA